MHPGRGCLSPEEYSGDGDDYREGGQNGACQGNDGTGPTAEAFARQEGNIGHDGARDGDSEGDGFLHVFSGEQATLDELPFQKSEQDHAAPECPKAKTQVEEKKFNQRQRVNLPHQSNRSVRALQGERQEAGVQFPELRRFHVVFSRSGKAIGEVPILFYSLVKWTVLAVVAGVLVGSITAFFLFLLEWGTEYVGGLGFASRFVLLPLGFLLSMVMVRKLAPEAKGHGTEKVIEAIHCRSGRISLPVVPVKLVATVITLAAGGSAGKEGPCAQIGAGLTSGMATLFRFGDEDRRKLVVCGISAGFAAIFGTPVAGAIFGVEVLFIGQMFYDVLLPSLISGIVAYYTASELGVSYFTEILHAVPDLSGHFFLWGILAGAFFGLVALLHIEIIELCGKAFERMKVHPYFKPLLGAGILLVATFFLGPRYLGLGTETIEAAVGGQSVPPLAFMIKSILTGITLSCGGSGGIVTPTFFVGATAGVTFSMLSGMNPAFCAALGQAAVLSGAANTPISATVMAIELFGSPVAPLAALACIVAFIVSGHRSVYPSQILARPKSKALGIRHECPVENAPLSPQTSDLLLPRLWEKFRTRNCFIRRFRK